MQRSLAKHCDMFLKSTTVGKATARKTKALRDNKEFGMVNANNCKINQLSSSFTDILNVK